MSEEGFPFILQYSQGDWKKLAPRIAEEAEISLSVNGELWLSFSCTPTDLQALGLGFLFTEGVIFKAAEVVSSQLCNEGTHLDIWLSHAAAKPTHWQRTSGCTGGVTRAQQSLVNPVAPRSGELSPHTISKLMEQLFKNQALYHEVRGVHCAAWSDGQSILLMAEDIGRHNTLDKLAGMLLLEPQPAAIPTLLTTGRISSEMLQKAALIGAEIVISRTSPTQLSVKKAHQAGITLIGYARNHQFSVYTHPNRVQGAPSTALALSEMG